MQIHKVKPWKRILGVIIILVGIAGLVLPILPGWLLIFIGLELFGLELVFFDKIKACAKRKIKEAEKRGKK